MEPSSPRRRVETNHLNRLRSSYKFFPEGKVTFGDKPDLLVHTSDGVVGIEHTQIFRMPDSKVTMQAQEKHQDRIVTQAQQIFEERSKTLYSLTVGFDPDLVLRPSDEHKVAGHLADLVDDIERDFDIAVDQDVCIQGWVYQQNGLGKFPSGISELYVKRVDRPGYALWDAGHGGTVSELTAELIQERLNEKGMKLTEYRRRCDKVWLLLVTDRNWTSSDFDLVDSAVTRIYHSSFDEIFYFDVFRGDVTKLKNRKRCA